MSITAKIGVMLSYKITSRVIIITAINIITAETITSKITEI